jgi:hypothetical protein
MTRRGSGGTLGPDPEFFDSLQRRVWDGVLSATMCWHKRRRPCSHASRPATYCWVHPLSAFDASQTYSTVCVPVCGSCPFQLLINWGGLLTMVDVTRDYVSCAIKWCEHMVRVICAINSGVCQLSPSAYCCGRYHTTLETENNPPVILSRHRNKGTTCKGALERPTSGLIRSKYSSGTSDRCTVPLWPLRNERPLFATFLPFIP